MSQDWTTVKEYEDITYRKCDGVARIAFNRPDVRNAFRPKTTSELLDAFHDAQEDSRQTTHLFHDAREDSRQQTH